MDERAREHEMKAYQKMCEDRARPQSPPKVESPIFAMLGNNDGLTGGILKELSVLKERMYPVLQPEPPNACQGVPVGQPMPPDRLVMSRLELHGRSLRFILNELQNLRDRLAL